MHSMTKYCVQKLRRRVTLDVIRSTLCARIMRKYHKNSYLVSLLFMIKIIHKLGLHSCTFSGNILQNVRPLMSDTMQRF